MSDPCFLGGWGSGEEQQNDLQSIWQDWVNFANILQKLIGNRKNVSGSINAEFGFTKSCELHLASINADPAFALSLNYLKSIWIVASI